MKGNILLLALAVGVFSSVGFVQNSKPHERPSKIPAGAVWLDCQPVTGKVVKYSVQFDFAAMGIEGRVSAVSSKEVTKIEKDGGFTVSSRDSGVLEFAGTKFDIGESKTTTSCDARGRVKNVEGEGGSDGQMRIAMMMNLVYPSKPVREGETWVERLTEDSKKGIVEAEAVYTFVGLEKINDIETAKIHMSFRELKGATPASSESDMFVDLRTGDLVLSESTWKQVPLPGGSGTADGRSIVQLMSPGA